MQLSDNTKRYYNDLSDDFYFELLSPHQEDMNSSNNCSLVCKVVEKKTGATYLVTGDTESDRWNSIVRYFGSALPSAVLAAPHHGSRNGITETAIQHISPHTVIVSAGVNNKYGHPHVEAVNLFRRYAQVWYQTNYGQGQSLRTEVTGISVNTYLFTV